MQKETKYYDEDSLVVQAIYQNSDSDYNYNQKRYKLNLFEDLSELCTKILYIFYVGQNASVGAFYSHVDVKGPFGYCNEIVILLHCIIIF